MSGFVISKSRIAAMIAWAQAGAGGVLRNIEEKLRESITLADYATVAQVVVAASGKRLQIGAGETVTVNVPGQFATIQAAFDAIAGWVIASTGTLIIKVADGTYVQAAGLVQNHPHGRRIQLIGNEVTPANCVIQVDAAGFDCLAVTNGHVLGYLNGFKFLKTAKALAADNTTGILANNGATIVCGPKIIVDNFYYGIAARNGSFIQCDAAQVDHAGDVGIWAFVGSSIQCRNAVSNNTADVANNLGFGIQAEYGSSIDCQGASATGCRVAGIAALSNSQVRALGATASGNAGSGLLARDGGTIEAHGATASNNARYGAEVLADGHVYYNAMTAAGNTINNFCNRGYFDNGANGARIVADDGPLRIDNSAAAQTYFNTIDGLQAEVFSTPGTAHWGLTAGAGFARMQVISGLATAAGELASKGAEVVRLRSNGAVAFQALSPAAAINYGQVDSSIAGNPVSFSAFGADAQIALFLKPKGGGCVMVPIASIGNYADDAAAAGASVPIGGFYRTGSALKVRAA